MDLPLFLRTHILQLTAVVGLVTYGLARNKFTPIGVLAGILVSGIHMLHPWSAFFWLLFIFVALGVAVTKVGHAAKAHITQSSSGGAGGEGARTSVQVLANSGWACVLILAHMWLLGSTPFISSHAGLGLSPGPYAPVLEGLLPVGIIAQYAAVAADTFSSELGILAKSWPVLVTAPWKRVPRGTNGGITVEGLGYGLLGGILLTVTAGLTLWGLPPYSVMEGRTAVLLALSGLVGSVIDSVLGATVQATITDKHTGKVVEGAGGTRVKYVEGGSRAQTGIDLLTNNGVNFAMAAITSLLAMAVAWATDLKLVR